MKNEKGYALVLVLLIITITFVFALSMSGMALSARKQFNKTDEVNKATDLAEMGVAHYETLVYKYVDIANTQAKAKIDEALAVIESKEKYITIPDYDEEFYKALNAQISKNSALSISVEGNNSYKVFSPLIKNLDSTKISIEYKSTGMADTETKLLDTTILVNKKDGSSSVGEAVPTKGSYAEFIDYPIDFKGNYGKDNDNEDKKRIDYFSAYFSKDVHIRGNRLIVVHGDAFFNSNVNFDGTADIIVYGDAIFRNRFDEPEQPNSSYTFCVTGNEYLIDNDRLIEYDNFPEGKKASCPNTKDTPWSIDPNNGIEVKY
ncbi:hypothetical protein V7654_20920 [Bacillus sp. JJ1609]|uniref:hypothetical protein n=1 Tax=Bacillus sp. JJ1609 TaxID=3122977 RepID=UPI003000C8FE